MTFADYSVGEGKLNFEDTSYLPVTSSSNFCWAYVDGPNVRSVVGCW